MGAVALFLLAVAIVIYAIKGVPRTVYTNDPSSRNTPSRVSSDPSEAEKVLEATQNVPITTAVKQFNPLHMKERNLYAFSDGSVLVFRDGNWTKDRAADAVYALAVLWKAHKIRTFDEDAKNLVIDVLEDYLEIDESKQAIMFDDGTAIEYNDYIHFWVISR
jgi:hypothetical protein